MKEKSILHSSIPLRGSETVQLDIFLSIKAWLIFIIITISPIILIMGTFLIYKFFAFLDIYINNKDIDSFVFFDKTFLILLVVSILLTIPTMFFTKKWWWKTIKEADKLITKDEYIRGSKLVCIDEFNKQFKDDEEFITFKIVNEKCEREF